jgi:excisionase family DNA binding protein
MESMMTAREVAELLGVHENWVYDQAASGALPSYKIGGTRRFVREEVLNWIAEHREPGRGRSTVGRIERPAIRRRPQDGVRRSRAASPNRSEDPQPRLFE